MGWWGRGPSTSRAFIVPGPRAQTGSLSTTSRKYLELRAEDHDISDGDAEGEEYDPIWDADEDD